MSGRNKAYVIDALRTPLGKRNGILSGVNSVDLLATLLGQIVRKNGLNPEKVDDIIIGCVDQVGEQGANIARNAWLSAGFPEIVPGVTVDRQCGSSLQSVQFAAFGIMSGMQDLVIAGGVESMSRVPMFSNIEVRGTPITNSLSERYGLKDEWFSQAAGAELIAKEFGISREDMDKFSLRSHMNAAESEVHLSNEIVPLEVKVSSNPGEIQIVQHDEGVRKNTSMEKLSGLRPAFDGLQLITAGNSSQITDGASAAIIASENAVRNYGFEPILEIESMGAVGVDPVTMLKGPIPVTEKVLRLASMQLEDIDVFEVNEAFAPVVLAWQKHFGIETGKINPHGGAIALGHPLGATGTRILSTMLNTMKSEKKDHGLIAICEGGGMANGAVLSRL